MAAPLTCVLAGWLGPPLHQVSLARIGNKRRVITGSRQGHVWLWQVKDGQNGIELRPSMLLVGHHSPIVAILDCRVEFEATEVDVVLTASEDGAIAMWSLDDGRCLLANQRAFPSQPRRLQLLSNGKQVLVSGNSNEVLVFDLTSLEPIGSVSQSNWATLACVQSFTAQTSDYLFTMTIDGFIRSWPLLEVLEKDDMLALRETQVNVMDAIDLAINPFQKLMLVVLARTQCLIFDSSSLRLMMKISPPSSTHISFSGLIFIDVDTILLSTDQGHGLIYRIPTLPFTDGLMAAFAAKGYVNPSKAAQPSQQQTPKGPEPKAILLTILERVNEPLGKSVFLLLHATKPPQYNKSSHVHLATMAAAAVAPPPVITHRVVAFTPTMAIMWSFSLPSGKIESTATPSSLHPTWETMMDNLFQFPTQTDWRPPNQVPSAVSLVREQWFVQGFPNGDIRATSVDNFGRKNLLTVQTPPTSGTPRKNSQSKSNNLPDSSGDVKTGQIKIFKGHTGKITCLCGTDTPNKNYLLSGSSDFTVRVWNIDTCELLYTFMTHTGEVSGFVVFPKDAGSRLRGLVGSIGKDNSLAIFSLDEMKCLYLLGGHPYPIVSLHWRSRDDYLITSCIDGTIYVWQMGTTGHLDRRAFGQMATDILQGCDGHISVASDAESSMSMDNPELLRSTAILSEGNAPDPQVEVMTFNLRRLLSSIHTSPDLDDDATNFQDNASSKRQAKPSSNNQGNVPHSLALVQVVASALVAWGLQASLDTICSDKLGLHRLPPNVTLGVRGANGNLAIMAPGAIESGREWAVSSFFTGHRLLLIVALTKALTAIQGLEEDSSTLLTHYCTSLQEALPQDKFIPPSLPYLATFWQDPLNDIQQSARSLFGSALSRMSTTELTSLVNYWVGFLPSPVPNKRGKYISALILGVIGIDKPAALPEKYRPAVAQSLLTMIMDDARGYPRAACTDLLGRGYATWQKYVNESQVLRILFNNAYMSPLNAPTATQPRRPFSLSLNMKDERGHSLDINDLASQWSGTTQNSQTMPAKRSNSGQQQLPPQQQHQPQQQQPTNTPSMGHVREGSNERAPAASLYSNLRALVSTSNVTATASTPPLPPAGASVMMNNLSHGNNNNNHGNINNGNNIAYISNSNSNQGNNPTPVLVQRDPGASSQNSQNQSLKRASRNALLQVATAMPKEFVQFLLTEKFVSRIEQERIGCLKLVSLIVKKKPSILYEHLDKVTEVVLRSLDVTNSNPMRESLMQPTVATLRDLVSAYPFIAFHTGTQRLALGTLDGCVVLFDVRTGTRIQVLEGHRSSVSAVAISPDGKLIAAFFIAEGTIRLWQTATAFLASVIGGNSRTLRSVNVSPPGLNKKPELILQEVRLEWISPQRVQLRNGREEVGIDVQPLL